AATIKQQKERRSSGAPSYTRRQFLLCHPQPPKDSLDFKLSTIYNHHTALFWSKNQMLCQRETMEKQLKLKEEQEKTLLITPRLAASDSWTSPSSAGLCTVQSAGPSSAPDGCIFAAMTR
uniref:Uncharacterized protein n=1 Tax=Poecilia mexicana TaxID=48701 RepID=A0A3B3XAF7_9TELE